MPELNPSQFQGHVTQAVDHATDSAPSSSPAAYAAPPFHLLDAVVPEAERGSWMYHGPSVRGDGWHVFKHGISREAIHLSEDGRGAHRTEATPSGWAGYDMSQPGRSGALLGPHYAMLEKMGESRTEPYDDGYIAHRNQRLRDAGYTTIQGGTG